MHNSLKVGEKAMLSKAFTEEEVFQFANIREDKPIITLKTVCINSEGAVVVEGEAVVKANIATGHHDSV
jgi:hypothetical protein